MSYHQSLIFLLLREGIKQLIGYELHGCIVAGFHEVLIDSVYVLSGCI